MAFQPEGQEPAIPGRCSLRRVLCDAYGFEIRPLGHLLGQFGRYWHHHLQGNGRRSPYLYGRRKEHSYLSSSLFEQGRRLLGTVREAVAIVPIIAIFYNKSRFCAQNSMVFVVHSGDAYYNC